MTAHCTLEELSTFVDKELAPDRTQLVEEHLTTCDDCAQRLRGLQRVRDHVRRLERVEPPTTLGWQVRQRIRLEGDRVPMPRLLEEWVSKLSWQSVTAPLFAMVVALGVISYLLSVGVARERQSTTRIVAAPELPGAAENAPQSPDRETARRDLGAAATPEISVAAGTPAENPRRLEVGGRSFTRRDGAWWQDGLERARPATTLVIEDWNDLPAALAWLRDGPSGSYIVLLDREATRIELAGTGSTSPPPDARQQ